MISLFAPAFESKIVSPDSLSHCIQRLARPLVFTNGVFDILHRGHVTYLARARALGASLVVAVNSDASVRSLGKGNNRPLNTEDDRAALIAALESVNLVTIFPDQVPLMTLEVARPDVYVKGGDYEMTTIRESELVQGWGGRVLAIAIEHERSTTSFLTRVRGLS